MFHTRSVQSVCCSEAGFAVAHSYVSDPWSKIWSTSSIKQQRTHRATKVRIRHYDTMQSRFEEKTLTQQSVQLISNKCHVIYVTKTEKLKKKIHSPPYLTKNVHNVHEKQNTDDIKRSLTAIKELTKKSFHPVFTLMSFKTIWLLLLQKKKII